MLLALIAQRASQQFLGVCVFPLRSSRLAMQDIVPVYPT